MPAMPMAESRPPIVVGIRQTSSATSTVTVIGLPWPAALHAIERKRQQRDAGDQEDDRHRREQDVEGDLVRRLLPLGAFDQGDHAVEKGFAGVGGDAHDEPVGEDARAAGDALRSPPALADDRGALAGDGAFIDRGDAFDDLAVRGDQIARLDQDDIALAECGSLHGTVLGVRGAARRASWPSLHGGSGAASRPGPCRVLRPSPRRSWRTAP